MLEGFSRHGAYHVSVVAEPLVLERQLPRLWVAVDSKPRYRRRRVQMGTSGLAQLGFPLNTKLAESFLKLLERREGDFKLWKILDNRQRGRLESCRTLFRSIRLNNV